MKNATKLLALLLFALLYSCSAPSEPSTPKPPPVSEETAALYILSEGLWGTNSSTIAYYSFENQDLDKDYFNTVNGRKLGDVGNDFKIYGSKIYIAVTTSSQVEVIDTHTGLSLKQLPLVNESSKPREPRYIAFDKGKAYVSCLVVLTGALSASTPFRSKLTAQQWSDEIPRAFASSTASFMLPIRAG